MAENYRVLFAGYGPVHFLCFRPLYERLRETPGVEIHLSGGLRSNTESGFEFDTPAMYEPLGVPSELVLSTEEIRERDFDVLFSSHTSLILPRSVTTRIQIFHGISFRNRAIRPENMHCDHYFVIGPYMRRRFKEAGLFEDNDPRAVPIGFMKTDRLLNGSLDRAELLEFYGFDGSRPVLLFAATGAKRNALETMGKEVIGRLAATGKYDILIKPHDHPKKNIDWFKRLVHLEDEHCRVTRELDVIPLLYLADLLISDASSVANEYALLNRPIVFLNTPELIEKARNVANSMLDLDTWGRKGGVIVDGVDDVVSTVDACLKDPSQGAETRERMKQDLFYNPGHATDAAFDWLRENLLGDRSRAE